MLKIVSLTYLNVTNGIREKTFWTVGFLFIFLLGFSLFLGQLSIGEKDVVLRSVSLSFIELSGLLLIVFGLTFNFYREKDTRLDDLYLSSFSQANYLAGKLFGNIIVCFIYVLITSLIVGLFLVINNSFFWIFFIGPLSIFLKLAVFVSICLLLSSFFNHYLLASIATVFAYVASEFSYSAFRIADISKSLYTKYLLKSVYHLLPNVDKLDLKTNAVYGDPLSLSYLVNIFAYVLIYITFSFLLALWIFSKKER